MMSVGFLAAYPEFETAGAELISAKLTEAAAQIDPTIWLHLTDVGHGLLTAHLLAIAPGGQQARMLEKSGTTTYKLQFDELREAVTCAIRVF